MFSKFIYQLTDADALAMWIFLLVALLMGLLLGYLIWGMKLKAVTEELEQTKKSLAALQAQYNELLEKYSALEVAHKGVSEELAQARIQIKTLENQKGQLYGDLMHATSRAEKAENLNDAIKADKAAVDAALAECLAGKSDKPAKPAEEPTDRGGITPIPMGIGDVGGGDSKAGAILQVIEGIGPKMEGVLHKAGFLTYDSIASTDDATILAAFKGNYNLTNEKLDEWQEQAALARDGKWGKLREYQLKYGGGSIAKVDKFVDQLGIADHPGMQGRTLSKKEKNAKSKVAAQKFKEALGTKIPKASASEKDDLKKISGVGPFIETKLNALGIYTFEQVSKFDDELIQTVTDAIQFFPGRIKRDNWVGQAGQFHKDKA